MMRSATSARCLILAPVLAILWTGCGGKDRETIKNVEVLMEHKDYDQALQVLNKALRDDPKNKKLLREQVILFLKGEQVSYSIAAYRKLTEVSPDDPVLRKAFSNEDPVVRVTAAKALGLMRDPESIDVLLGAANDPEKSVRQAVILALGDLKEKKAIPVLMKSLDDDDWFVRAEAALALGKIGDTQAAARLFQMLGDKDSYVRQNARKALQDLCTDENKPAYLEALKSQDAATRTMAAIALAYSGDASGMAVLTNQLGIPQNPDAPEILRAMVKLKDPQCLPAMRSLMGDPNPNLRAMAILGLGEMGDKESAPKLKQMATDKSLPGTVRTACLVALNKITSAP